MKKILYCFLMICFCAAFIPHKTAAQAEAQTVNESGGASASLDDGLKFVVNTNGALSVYRENQTQYYNGYVWPEGAGRGVALSFRFDNGTTYNSTKAIMTACSTTPVKQEGNTYTTSISGYVRSTIQDNGKTPTFYVTLNVKYTHPNRYFLVDYIVRAPSTLTVPQTVHLYLDHDAYILGSDGSRGYRSSNTTGEFVGDYRLATDNNSTCSGSKKNPHFPSCHGFKTKKGFRSYYSAKYSSRNSIDNANLKLLDSINTVGCIDDGIAVEFTVGPLAAGMSGARQVAHCYGNTQTEFDNLAVEDPVMPTTPSTPITINFKSATFTETEGNHVASNVKIIVSGGLLSYDQICTFKFPTHTLANPAVAGTDFTYVQGFTIPAGDYSTPKEFTLDNITIKDNNVCNEDKNVVIEISGGVGVCNDLIQAGTNYRTVLTIQDDDPHPHITSTLTDMTVNSTDVVPAINLTSDIPAAVISWTNNNTAIGLAAGGTGNIPSFTATNTTSAPITATITVKATTSCDSPSETFTITVNPRFGITYDFNGGVAPVTPNPTDYLIASLPLTIPNEPTRTGYTFAGWTGSNGTTPQKPVVVPTGTTGALSYKANWTANTYTISYSLPAGAVHTQTPASYTIETGSVSIANPTLPGYTFNGWTTIANDDPTCTFTIPTTNSQWSAGNVWGNLTFTVTDPGTGGWTPITYKITYDLAGGVAGTPANPTTYVTTDNFTLSNPTRTGYTFAGWTGSNGTTPQMSVNVVPGTIGDLNYKANWTANTYNISYDIPTGVTHPQTPTSYIFTETKTVADPEMPGYEFKGWTIGYAETASPKITPTKGVSFGNSTVFGDIKFKVTLPPNTGGDNDNWHQLTYNITYNLAEGTAGTPTNPATYVTTDNFTLSNPTRTGYTFAGWTGSNGTTPQTTVTVVPGTIGDLNYTAHWTANTYDISYVIPTGVTHPQTPTSYIFTETKTVADPEMPGYEFKGWTIGYAETASPKIAPTKGVSFGPSTVFGNLEFKVTLPPNTGGDNDNWHQLTYNITYDLAGGTAGTPANRTTYVTTDNFTLSNPTRNGYTFAGWTGSNGTTPQTTVTVVPGTIGDLNYTAHWTENTYNISYVIPTGVTHSQTPNSYKFTQTQTVADPAMPGYTFKGWTISNDETTSPAITPTKGVSFGPSTVFGNLEFKVTLPPAGGGGNANWDQITYNITYNLDGGTYGASHPDKYTVTDNVSIDIPTKSGRTFAGWTITSDDPSATVPASGNPTTFGPGSNVYGNLTLKANWSTDAYMITYLPGAPDASFTNNTNRKTYSIDDTPITLNNGGAKRNGYSFVNWKIEGNTNGGTIPNGMSILAGTTGNLTCTAQWSLNTYTIGYTIPTSVTHPATKPTSYNVTQNVTVSDPSMPGYTFKGWTITNDETSSPAVAPTIGVSWNNNTIFGNLNFKVDLPPTNGGDNANWSENTYTITYDYAGGTAPTAANPVSYKITTPTITLNDPIRNGYTLTGWTIVSDATGVTVPAGKQIPKGTYGNLKCTAVWSLNTYNIVYAIPTGVTNPAANPATYDVTQNVTVADPSMPGYTFQGWTITNDAPSSPAVTPIIGVSWNNNTIFGNLNFKVDLPPTNGGDNANWSENTYTITYDYAGGTAPTAANPISYKITTPTITLNDPIRNGYTLTGWTIVSDATGVTVPAGKQIPKGTYGNLTCTAVWSLNTYNIVYTIPTGVTNPAANPATYDVTQNVTVADPSMPGYTFQGWTITNDAPSSPAVTPIIGVSWNNNTIFGNLNFKVDLPPTNGGDNANWSENTYTITYDYAGGTAPTAANPINYTITTPTITLNDPIRGGYTLDKWTIVSDAAGVTVTDGKQIPKGTYGNLTCKAVWKVIPYTITYDYNDNDDASDPSTTPANPTGYDMDNLPVNIDQLPVRKYWDFKGWTGFNGTTPQTSVTVAKTSTGVPGNLTLTANWTKKKYHVTYNLNGGSGTAPVEPGSPCEWGSNITVLAATSVSKANAVFLGWTTTQIPYDLTTPTDTVGKGFKLPGNSYTIQKTDNPLVFYAVWAEDKNGPDGIPDGIPDYLQRSLIYKENPAAELHSTSGALPPTTMHTMNTSATTATNVNNLALCDTVTLAGWSTTVPCPLVKKTSDKPAGFVHLGQTIPVGDADINLYAVWALDKNGNGIPDYDEPSADTDPTDKWPDDSDWDPTLDEEGKDAVYSGCEMTLTVKIAPDITDRDILIHYLGAMKNGFLVDENGKILNDHYVIPAGDSLLTIRYTLVADSITDDINGQKGAIETEVVFGDRDTVWMELYGTPKYDDVYVKQYIDANGRIDLGIKGGSPNLMRSINGGAWHNINEPLTNRERLSVDNGVDIRVRQPNGCWEEIFYFDSYNYPEIKRYVYVSYHNDVVTTPNAGTHYVEGHKDFSFDASFINSPLKISAYGYYSGNEEELIGVDQGNGTYRYTLLQVTEPWVIQIGNEPASAVDNENVHGVYVWAHKNMLYIKSDMDNTAYIYNLSGTLYKQLDIKQGSTNIEMERGVYVILIGEHRYKVIIK